MSLREDTLNILHYKDHQHFPIVHFGYWPETIEKWNKEGHLSDDEARDVWDNSPNENALSTRLGFDFNWNSTFGGHTGLYPAFEPRVLEVLSDGHVKQMDENGVIVLTKPGVVSIPAEIGHTLTDRQSWEGGYRHRLLPSEDRYRHIDYTPFTTTEGREKPIGIFCGSLYGYVRNYLGVEGTCYLLADDEELFTEIIDTNAEMQYKTLEAILAQGVKPDYAHFWEDICFKNGPLVSPSVFAEKVGPWYRRFTQLLAAHGVDIVTVDCDGMIDALLPVWLENGVNGMFPIEVGTWNASIAPWRDTYGKKILGIGGMNKTVFAQDYKAVDAEVERLRRLVDLGGYIPCPDHRIAPDAKWENVQYYCEQLRKVLNP